MSELRTIMQRGVGDAAPPPEGFERMLRRRDRKRRKQRITASVVGIVVFLAAIGLVVSSPSGRSWIPGGTGRSQPSGPPEPTIAPDAGGIVGIPTPGTTPSTPEHGKLILYLEGSFGGSPTALWIYADGRLIWGDVFGNLPSGAPIQGEGATGFVEQHLTPSWVESLRTQVLSTGLFEQDLALLRGAGDPPFLTIQVRNHDRLVRMTWAVAENWDVSKDAPSATPEQASTLEWVHGLLTDPTSWPASAWEDQVPKTFVPSRYHVWLRLFPDQGPGPNLTVGEREVALLPAPARDLLRAGTKMDGAFYDLTTDETRALAEALNEGGLEPLTMPLDESVLRYGLEDPYQPGNSLFLFFGPVLPHGEAIFLGPG